MAMTAAAAGVAVDLVMLGDGRVVQIRPVVDADADGLVELHLRCSPASRYFRFHSPKPRLRPVEAAYLAGAGGSERVALVATIVEDGEERIVADARIEPTPTGDGEVALLVRDDLQGIGLGRRLLTLLIDAAARRGRRRLLLHVLADNHAMLTLASEFDADPISSDGPVVLLAIIVAPVARSPVVAGADN
jgi:GNAT superfamily N-acetyltransferase